MVEADSHEDTFVPDKRICVIIMNGKTNLLVLNRRYAQGYADLTVFLAEDEKTAKEIAKELGMDVIIIHNDIDKTKFNAVIRELRRLIELNAEAGLKTFVYLQYGGHAVGDDKGLT